MQSACYASPILETLAKKIRQIFSNILGIISFRNRWIQTIYKEQLAKIHNFNQLPLRIHPLDQP